MTNLELIAASDENYSAQAITLIANLKDNFDVVEFEAWWRARQSIGGGHIMEYLQEQDAHKNVTLPQEQPNNLPA